MPQVRESLLDEVSTARGSGWVVASSDVKASFLQRVCAALYEPVDISFLVFPESDDSICLNLLGRHPPNSLLAQEASAVIYDWDTDTLLLSGMAEHQSFNFRRPTDI